MKILWKIYSVLYAIIACIVVISLFSDDNLTLLDYIDVFLNLFTVLATILWSWKKSLGSQKLWIIYCCVYFTIDAVYNIFFTEFNGAMAEYFIGLAIILPSYLATILYAINFKAIESKKHNNSLHVNDNRSAISGFSLPADPAANVAWNMQAEHSSDAQLLEIRRQQNISAAKNSMAESLSKEVQTNYEEKIEAEQLGKWPWDRWYTHAVVGRDHEKGIADIIFLTFFPVKSKTSENSSQRAIIRVLVTLLVILVLSYIGHYLTGA